MRKPILLLSLSLLLLACGSETSVESSVSVSQNQGDDSHDVLNCETCNTSDTCESLGCFGTTDIPEGSVADEVLSDEGAL